ncbi:MAG: hypothetical protein IJA08_01835 [Clostridia bacterium]|nr:hypothetical protein [Clostridia bacterium]
MSRKKVYVWYVKSAVIYVLLLSFLLLFILRSESVMEEIISALGLCYHTMIPSLFPFFVLSGLMMEFDFATVSGTLFSPVMRPLFRVRGSGAAAFVIGLFCGYPTGAKIVVTLYKKNQISRTEGMRLLPFCNNSGPLFVIGAVGVGMLGSVELGIYLFVIHALSAFLVGILFRFYGRASGEKEHKTKVAKKLAQDVRSYWSNNRKSVGQVFSDCVLSSVNTTLLICGFIVLFSAANASFAPLISALRLPVIFEKVVKGMLEVSMGTKGIAELYELPMRYILSLLSFLIGFGGACVHLQVLGILAGSGLSMKTYLSGKCLQALISAGLSYVLFELLPEKSTLAWNSFSGGILAPNLPWFLPVLICVLALLILWYQTKKRIDF